MALLASWKARWASIMSVIAVAASTLEASSVPCDKVVDFAAARSAPLPLVATKVLSRAALQRGGRGHVDEVDLAELDAVEETVPSAAIVIWLGVGAGGDA